MSSAIMATILGFLSAADADTDASAATDATTVSCVRRSECFSQREPTSDPGVGSCLVFFIEWICFRLNPVKLNSPHFAAPSLSIGKAFSSAAFALRPRSVSSRMVAGLNDGGDERGGNSLKVTANLK